MSQNATTQQARTVNTIDRGKLDLKALTLYAILLAAGFVLNMTVSKFFSGLTGGILSPEFIIAAFCLETLIIKPKVGQAAVLGLLAGVVIQITASVKGPDLIAEPVAAVVMALLVSALGNGGAKKVLPSSAPLWSPASPASSTPSSLPASSSATRSSSWSWPPSSP